MTSRISTRKLLLQEIRQNGWMFGLTGLLHFMTGPVVFLLNTSNLERWTEETAARRFVNAFSDTFVMWQLFTILACIGISIFTYKYLFTKRMVDLYHSVPIKRGQLFRVKYLHGLLIWLIPFVGNLICMSILALIRAFGKAYLPDAYLTLAKSALLLLLCFVIFYHLFLTAVYLSGNVLNLAANAAIIGGCVGITYLILSNCADTFFDTFCYQESRLLTDMIYGLTPAATPLALVNAFASGRLSEHIPLVFISIVAAIGMLGVAWVLYLSRPSELAERGTIAGRYTIPAGIAASIVVGIAGSLFFAELSNNDQKLAWGIFGSLLCSILCFGALTSIFGTTIKLFFRHWKTMLATAAVSTAVILIFQLDLFGYDTYLPRKETLSGISIYISQLTDDSGRMILTDGMPSYESGQNVLQDADFRDRDICYDLLRTMVDTTAEDADRDTVIKVKVALENGRIYERRYWISNEDRDMLRPLVEAESYKAQNYKFSTGAFGYPTKLNADFWNAEFELTDTQLVTIYDAYVADFNEHYSLDHLSSYMERCRLSGKYGSDEINSHYFSLPVPDTYTRTLAALEEAFPGYTTPAISPEDLKAVYMDSPVHFGYKLSPESFREYYDGREPSSDVTKHESTGVGEVVIIEQNVKPQTVTYSGKEMYIEDPELLEQLYPYLTFGSYRGIFDRNEYILMGSAALKNYSNMINCYVRAGELPDELILDIYEFIVSQLSE